MKVPVIKQQIFDEEVQGSSAVAAAAVAAAAARNIRIAHWAHFAISR